MTARCSKCPGLRYSLSFNFLARIGHQLLPYRPFRKICSSGDFYTNTCCVAALEKKKSMKESLQPLVIVGAGGFGREVAWLVHDINIHKPTWDLLGFVDANPEVHGTTVGGYPVLGGYEWVKKRVAGSREPLGCDGEKDVELHAVVAVGASAARRKIIRAIESPCLRYATLVHPTVLMERTSPMAARVGVGTVICANSILTVDVRVGDHVIINLACTVGHDTVIGDFATLLPTSNISGCSNLADGVLIGTGTQVLEGRTIGAGTIVGAGSVVVKDLPPSCTAVGAPARAIKLHDRQWHRADDDN